MKRASQTPSAIRGRETVLRALWPDESITVARIAELAGFGSTQSAYAMARRLDLPHRKRGPKPK